MDDDALQQLPSTYYRAAVKVLVMDELGRLLVVQNDVGSWEIPGGGWEHDETLYECVEREMMEELSVKVANVSDVEFVLRGRSKRGTPVLRLAVRATLVSNELKPADDIVDFRYVNRHDFLQLQYDDSDLPFQDATADIWGE